MITWENSRELNGDYFIIMKSKRSDIPLDYYLDKIDLENYWVYKSTNAFRRVEVESIGKYGGYMLFKKDLYCKEDTDKWIVEIRKIDNDNFMYLGKPFPRIEILEKIEVI